MTDNRLRVVAIFFLYCAVVVLIVQLSRRSEPVPEPTPSTVVEKSNPPIYFSDDTILEKSSAKGFSPAITADASSGTLMSGLTIGKATGLYLRGRSGSNFECEINPWPTPPLSEVSKSTWPDYSEGAEMRCSPETRCSLVNSYTVRCEK